MASRLSGRRRAVAYLLLAAALIALSWWTQASMHPLTAVGVVLAVNRLFYSGVLLLGVGLYCRRDTSGGFLIGVGACTLAAWAVTFVLYGGMENAAAAGADTAANVLMVLWTMLPLAVLVRTAGLIEAVRREVDTARGRVLWLAFAGLALWVLILIVTGQFFGFVHLGT